MSFRFGLVVLCLCSFLLATDRAEGAIIVSFQGNVIAAGGTGFVDVFVSSNSDPLLFQPPDVLDSFSAHFRITPVGGAVAGGLQFVNPQSDSQLSMPGYIFDPVNSLAVQFGVPVGVVSTFADPNDDFSGGDGTVNGLGESLDNTSGQFRLFRFNLDASLANPGDQYEIALIDDFGSQFLDPSFGPLILHSSSFQAFTITASVAAVPEPASGGLIAALGLSLWAKRRWSKRWNTAADKRSLQKRLDA